jgi:hypothetical protein
VQELVAQIDDRTSAAALVTERAVVRRLGGGCQMPIGAFAEIHERSIRARGIVISLDGADAAHGEAEGSLDAPEMWACASPRRCSHGGPRTSSTLCSVLATAEAAVDSQAAKPVVQTFRSIRLVTQHRRTSSAPVREIPA